MQFIAIANHKGGCGKTTTSIHFASCLAHLGKKVLLIDLDPQGHATCGLGIRAEDLPYTLYDFLRLSGNKSLTPDQILYEVSANLWLIPTYGILSALEEELVQIPLREKYLEQKLSQLLLDRAEIDYVIMDCPPNLGLLTYNALEVADEVIVPIEPSFFSLHGLGKMMETIQACQGRLQREIVVHALLTIFDSGLSFSEEIYDEVKTHFGKRLFKAIIHQDVAFKEAASAGQSIIDYDMESRACQDYLGLSVEYLERELERLLPSRTLGWDKVYENHFGPRKVAGGILFQSHCEKASWIEIAGDFNQWIPERMIKRDGAGLWQKVIPVGKGRFRYKFIIDGEWQMDPTQPAQTNEFGGVDSFLEIG